MVVEGGDENCLGDVNRYSQKTFVLWSCTRMRDGLAEDSDDAHVDTPLYFYYFFHVVSHI